MAVTVDQFGKALVASGLMTGEEVKALWATIPSGERPKDGDGFAQVLVKQEKLNAFQAQELLSGSGTPLVLNQYVLLSKIGAGPSIARAFSQPTSIIVGMAGMPWSTKNRCISHLSPVSAIRAL